MAKMTYAELRKATDEELVTLYDAHAPRVDLPLGYLREELHRRQTERQARTMVRLTWVIGAFTAIVTIATVVNVLAS